MKIISHRGNLKGPEKSNENKPKQIDLAIKNGFEVEIDLWIVNGNFLLGHDRPEHVIDLSWALNRSKYLWIHCKNIELLDYFIINRTDLNFFFHQNDHVALTSKFHLWVYPEKTYTKNSILVSNNIDNLSFLDNPPFGVCTDFPVYLNELCLKKQI
jgi:hypothetical protein